MHKREETNRRCLGTAILCLKRMRASVKVMATQMPSIFPAGAQVSWQAAQVALPSAAVEEVAGLRNGIENAREEADSAMSLMRVCNTEGDRFPNILAFISK